MLDLAGADADLARACEEAAADNITRVLRAAPEERWQEEPGLDRLRGALEAKTVWHPVGR